MGRKRKAFLVMAIIAASMAGAEIVEVKTREKRRGKRALKKRHSKPRKLAATIGIRRKKP
jgi:predicted CopG family antitoxin